MMSCRDEITKFTEECVFKRLTIVLWTIFQIRQFCLLSHLRVAICGSQMGGSSDGVVINQQSHAVGMHIASNSLSVKNV